MLASAERRVGIRFCKSGLGGGGGIAVGSGEQ